MGKKNWDDYSLDNAKALYNEGRSHGQIANALQKDGYTVTRSAVIGKLKRIEHTKTQPSRVQRARTDVRSRPDIKAPPRQPSAPKPKPAPIISEERAIEYVGPIGTTPAWGFCQFTRDDVNKRDAENNPAWQMCGHPAQVKGEGRQRVTLPWCESHTRICYQPQQSRKNAD